MGHITVDRHDFNAAQIGMKPVGVTPVVPRLADAKLELAEDDRRNHHLGRRSQHGLDRPVSLRPCREGVGVEDHD